MVLSRAIANNIYTICGTPSLERRYPASRNGGFTAQEYSTKSWEHEKEYRIVYPLDENSKGMNVPIHRLGMRTSRIVAGINCSEDNKKKLNEISNSLGLGNVYTSRIHSEQYTIDYVR